MVRHLIISFSAMQGGSSWVHRFHIKINIKRSTRPSSLNIFWHPGLKANTNMTILKMILWTGCPSWGYPDSISGTWYAYYRSCSVQSWWLFKNETSSGYLRWINKMLYGKRYFVFHSSSSKQLCITASAGLFCTISLFSVSEHMPMKK